MSTLSSPRLAHLLESFFRQRLLLQRRASPNTVAAYRDTLRLLVVFTAEEVGRPPCRLDIEDLDRDRVLAFLDHLEKERGNSPRTRNARLAAIRAFYQYISYLDPMLMGSAQRVLAIPNKRVDRPVLGYLRTEELDAVLAAPVRSTVVGRRDYTIILFLAETGARVSEAVAVDAADVRFVRPRHVRLVGKGRRERLLPLDQDLGDALRDLGVERGLAQHDVEPLFVGRRGGRLTRFGVTHLLRRAVGIACATQPQLADRQISPHTLRHTAAMRLLQSGVDLTTIRSWLGHVHVDTTHHYLEIDLEMKRRALATCAPPGSPSMARYDPPDDVLALLDEL